MRHDASDEIARDGGNARHRGGPGGPRHQLHLAVSRCPSAPRRYRGRDVFWWLLQCFLHGGELGIRFPTLDRLPSPAARFACNPHLSGRDGGYDIDLRRCARAGMHLYGQLEAVEGTRVRFSDDLPERLAFADAWFDRELRPMFDAYIAAAGVDAPDDERAARDGFVPPTCAELDLDVAGIRSVVWATGYRLDFGWVDLPVLDEWGYPRHVRGVTTHPGLYAAVRRARWSASSRWQTSRERMLRHAGGRQPGARAR